VALRRGTLRRRAVVGELLAARGDALVVSGLGGTTWDVAAALGDEPTHFPLWGAMGGALMVGLGLALARPRRRVLVVTGDGELLMGLGSLATVACERPRNLAVAVIDNARYGETGMQPSHTAAGVDLAGIAAAAGFAATTRVRSRAEVAAALELLHGAAGPTLAVFEVRAESPPMVLPERQGPWLKERFRRALGIAPR